jgi:folate-binding protein YgfZ
VDAFWVELPRDAVMVHGPDAETYLHSQLSQEVRGLPVGAARWSWLLQPTGKVDALVRVLRSGDQAFVLDVDAGWGDAVVARLNRFRIRVKAEVVAVPWRCVAVRGEGAGAVAPAGGAVALAGPWPGVEAVDLLGPDPAPPPGIGPGRPEAYEAARVAAGWPAMGAELTEATIPGETGLVAATVSFTKGCYPGQELVERIDSRGGNVARRLCRLALAGGTAPVVPGDRLHHEGRDVGWITSVAGERALAYVGRAVEIPARLAAGEAQVAVQVLDAVAIG